MVKSFATETVTALAQRRLVKRDFLTITARERDTGDPVTVGFWSDLQDVVASVINPETGTSVSRTFYGAGALITISDVPAILGITVQRITIQMVQFDDFVEQAIRLYDCKQARVEIHTGLLSPDTRALVAPAEVLFVGFVDEITLPTPAEGDTGAVTLTCTSHTQELARSNPETRSHADQLLRDPDDDFFIDAATCGDWVHHWGAAEGKSQPEKQKRPDGSGGMKR